MSAEQLDDGDVDVDVAIVGGGIGGLAAAVALRRAGIDAHVYERTEVLREVGGAVIIREPSVRLLEEWGLGAFHEQAVPVQFVDLFDGDGTFIRTDSTDFVGDGECWSAHRADVHDLLRSGVAEDHIHLGAQAAGVTADDEHERAVVELTDGSRVAARLVVGADGIRSVVRRAVCRDPKDEAVFQGVVVTRSVTPASALPDGMANDRVHVWTRGPKMILALPMRGGTLIAVDCTVSALAVEDLPKDDLWYAEIPTQTLLEQYADFDPRLLRLIECGIAPVRANPVYDREPIETWADGRIVLLGDAAHPMAPRQGQGANQAMQDAGALAQAVARFGLDDPAGALGHYQDLRVGPATALQRASRQIPKQLSTAAAH